MPFTYKQANTASMYDQTTGAYLGTLGLQGQAIAPVSFTPQTNDYAGILAAYNACVAAGGGTVQLLPVTYNIGGNYLPLSNGITYKGSGYTLYYPNNISDDWAVYPSAGTIINGNGTNAGFYWQGYNGTTGNMPSTAQYTLGDLASNPPSPWNNYELTGSAIQDLAITNCTYGVKIGALRNLGAAYSNFKNIVAVGCTYWGFWFENMIHVNYDQLTALNCGTLASSTFAAGGFKYANSISGYSNCDIGTILCTTPTNLLARGIEMRQRLATLGGIATINRIQCNRFNNPASIIQSVTANGTTTLTVADGTKYAPDLPVVVTAAGTTNLTTNQVYVVGSVSGNTITLKNKVSDTVALTITGTTGASLFHSGFAPWTVTTDNAGTGYNLYSVNSTDFEAGGTCSVYFEYVTPCALNATGGLGPNALVGSPSTATPTMLGLVLRLSAITINSNTTIIIDADPSSNDQSIVYGSSPLVYANVLSRMQYYGATTTNTPQGSNKALNISGLYNGYPTLMNQLGNGGGNWILPAVPIGVRQMNATSLVSTLTQAYGAGYANYCGTGIGTYTYTSGGGSYNVTTGVITGFRQVIKNSSAYNLTVTLDTSDGTFDGVSGVSLGALVSAVAGTFPLANTTPLTVGGMVRVTSAGTTGLVVGTNYYVTAIVTNTSFTIAADAAGTAISGIAVGTATVVTTGKSIVLAGQANATTTSKATSGGSLVFVASALNGSYVWSIESLLNGTIV